MHFCLKNVKVSKRMRSRWIFECVYNLSKPDFSSWHIFSKKVVGFMILTRQACIKIHIYVLQTRPLYFRINLQKDEVFKKVFRNTGLESWGLTALWASRNTGGFHLHPLVFPFVNQFNSRIGVLVNSSFAND